MKSVLNILCLSYKLNIQMELSSRQLNLGIGKKTGQEIEIYVSQWQCFKALILMVVDREPESLSTTQIKN